METFYSIWKNKKMVFIFFRSPFLPNQPTNNEILVMQTQTHTHSFVVMTQISYSKRHFWHRIIVTPLILIWDVHKQL